MRPQPLFAGLRRSSLALRGLQGLLLEEEGGGGRGGELPAQQARPLPALHRSESAVHWHPPMFQCCCRYGYHCYQPTLGEWPSVCVTLVQSCQLLMQLLEPAGAQSAARPILEMHPQSRGRPSLTRPCGLQQVCGSRTHPALLARPAQSLATSTARHGRQDKIPSVWPWYVNTAMSNTITRWHIWLPHESLAILIQDAPVIGEWRINTPPQQLVKMTMMGDATFACAAAMT